MDSRNVRPSMIEKRFRQEELKVLKEYFEKKTQHPTREEIFRLSCQLMRPMRKIQIWFQNERAKMKKTESASSEKANVNEVSSSSSVIIRKKGKKEPEVLQQQHQPPPQQEPQPQLLQQVLPQQMMEVEEYPIEMPAAQTFLVAQAPPPPPQQQQQEVVVVPQMWISYPSNHMPAYWDEEMRSNSSERVISSGDRVAGGSGERMEVDQDGQPLPSLSSILPPEIYNRSYIHGSGNGYM